jgi:hypothetical protein
MFKQVVYSLDRWLLCVRLHFRFIVDIDRGSRQRVPFWREFEFEFVAVM